MKKLLLSILIITGCEETLEPEDCPGVAGGTAVEDACGECEGDGSSCSLTVTDIDGNVYETVQIGGQLWMAENLNVTHYNNPNESNNYLGDEIPTGYSDEEWTELETGAYAVYPTDNDEASQSTCGYDCADVYGNLYNWYAVDDDRGVCPEGWHVPTDDEWTILTDDLGGTSEAVGGKMKSTGTIEGGDGLWDYLWHCAITDTHYQYNAGGKTFCNNNCTESCIGQTEEATNESEFTGLPAGYRSSSNGNYYNMGAEGSFWSSSEESSGSDSAWHRRLYYYGSNVGHQYYSKHFSFSIRCLGD